MARARGNQIPGIPDRRLMERHLRAAEKLLQEQEFESIEEANAFLREASSQGELNWNPETPLEQAQELIYQALEAPNRRQQINLARGALAISPDCTDAYVLLAEQSTNPRRACELYQKGVDAGERSLGPEVLTEEVGHFWGIIETRPYMRARYGLAQCLWELGEKEAAVKHYRELLRLNPNDNQGVRSDLLNALLQMDNLEEAEELLQKYQEDWSADWLYTRALVRFLRQGDSPQSRKALEDALEENPYVPANLLGEAQLPRSLPPLITLGDPSEAIHYAAEFRGVWAKARGALAWLEANRESLAPSLEEAEEKDGAEAVGELPFPFASPSGLGFPFTTGLDEVVAEESFTEPAPEEWADLPGSNSIQKSSSLGLD